MGAIVTTFYIESPSNHRSYCGILRWCRSAQWAAQRVSPAAEVLIFTNELGVPIVQRECPHAHVRPFEPGLLHLVERWASRRGPDALSRPERPGSSCPLNTLLKWEVINARHYTSLDARRRHVVLYLDSDVDVAWVTSDRWLAHHDFARKLDDFYADDYCELRATPDHMAPVNTGIMLLKPNTAMYVRRGLATLPLGLRLTRNGTLSKFRYREGLAVLRTRSWGLQSGFNFTGSPKAALAGVVTGPRAEKEVLKVSWCERTHRRRRSRRVRSP